MKLHSKFCKELVYSCIAEVKSAVIEEAILISLQNDRFQKRINTLKHLKFWMEAGGKCQKIIKSKAIQEILNNEIPNLSSEYRKEFKNLLDLKFS